MNISKDNTENKKLKESFTKHSGITLIALVVTMVIIILLAGVSITAVVGENGLLTLTDQTRQNIEDKVDDSKTKLNELEKKLEE